VGRRTTGSLRVGFAWLREGLTHRRRGEGTFTDEYRSGVRRNVWPFGQRVYGLVSVECSSRPITSTNAVSGRPRVGWRVLASSHQAISRTRSRRSHRAARAAVMSATSRFHLADRLSRCRQESAALLPRRLLARIIHEGICCDVRYRTTGGRGPRPGSALPRGEASPCSLLVSSQYVQYCCVARRCACPPLARSRTSRDDPLMNNPG
jgi:hypothetical protein